MDSETINFGTLQTNTAAFANTSSKINLGEVFAERKGSYLNELTLFIAHFNYIPNLISEIKIDCKRANQWFLENYTGEIKHLYFNKQYIKGSRQAEYDDIFYILHEDLIVNFDTNFSVVRFLFRKTDIAKVETINAAIKKFKRRKEKCKPEICLLVNTRSGIETKKLQVTRPR